MYDTESFKAVVQHERTWRIKRTWLRAYPIGKTMLGNQIATFQQALFNGAYPKWPLLLLFLLGIGLRLGRLTWQPLWADEGYSLYFATEPLSRMLWLTANDIHPPLYYALLHLWANWLATPEPAVARLFTFFVSLPALFLLTLLARLLFPNRPRVLFIATLLLAINPFHIFYSQEVRMYGLAMTLSLAASITFWLTFIESAPRDRSGRVGYRWLGYIAFATAALYTLYYCAFLLMAHALWALWIARRQWRKLSTITITYALIALLYAPWVMYTTSTLALYIEDKIASDQDQPLGLLTYLSHHLLAFLSGHLSWPTWPLYWRWGAVGALILLLLPLYQRYWQKKLPNASRQRVLDKSDRAATSEGALWTFLLLPTAIAFGVNRLFPFFPDGGERLLLFVLPYTLLLIAVGIEKTWQWNHWGKGILLLLLLSAGGGIVTFYTLPRHRADDYRPLIRQVIQQGNDEDTLLATFPWQVGLWRAYEPQAYLTNIDPLQRDPLQRDPLKKTTHGPQIVLLSERSVVWGDPLRIAIDRALTKGTLWYPGLRSIGSTLPTEIDRYLTEELATEEGVTQRPILLVDSWYGNTTLRAWYQLPAPELIPHTVDFGVTQLVAAGVTPTTVASANTPLRIDLQWTPPVEADPAQPTHGMTIRLVGDGRQWANNDLAKLTNVAGLIVPAGLPPGGYELLLGVVDADGQLLPPVAPPNTNPDANSLISLAVLTITTPVDELPAARLPIQKPFSKPVALDGITLLGYSANEEIPLAGETMAVTLFWQNGPDKLPLRNLYVSLLDATGRGVAGWEGWPSPHYPTTDLAPGALLQTPLEFALPATLESDTYQLGAGLLDPASGQKSSIVILGEQAVKQRTINYTHLQPSVPLAPPTQFGSHVLLMGYDVALNEATATIQLYWHVLQPLLPPHHIFIHLTDDTDQPLAQSDDEPHTPTGRAPTGSWLPTEYLVTEHQIVAAALESADITGFELNIGLYVPATGQRLPTVSEATVTGDHVTLPLQP